MSHCRTAKIQLKFINLISIFLLIMLMLAGLPAPLAGQAAAAKLQSYLAKLAVEDPNEQVRVIIQLTAPLRNARHLVESAGGRYLTELSLINAVVAEAPAAALPRLAQLPTVRQIALDAPVVKMSESGDGLVDIRDEFDQPAYANSDGEGLWAGAWQEVGESDGPQEGNVAITPFWGGALQGLRLQGAAQGAMRAVDLAWAEDATLSISYRRKAFADENAFVTLAISQDGGATWQELTRWQGPATDSEIQHTHIDISAFAGANTQVRLLTADAMSDESKFYLDAIKIQAIAMPGASANRAAKVYLPLVAGQAASMLTGADSDETVQAAAYSTSALVSTFVRSIGAHRLWTEAPAYLTGNQVTVAVVDSGITEHADLKWANGQSRVLARVNFVQDGKSPDDYFGHGTHVAGIVGGNGTQSGGKYMGVAPDANLLDVKVTDDHGAGKMSDVVAGLQWVLNNKNTYNIRIVNLSLNSSVPDSYHVSPLSAAVEILWFNGIVVVVSAGNDGSYKLNSPANDPFVITVGAVDDKGTIGTTDDELAKFSGYNITEDGFAKPDLVAPGRNLVALLSADDNNLANTHPGNRLSGSEGSYYYRMSGTSMASGVVAGAVALLLQDEPTLTPDQVKHRLMATAKPFTTSQGCATGAGYLDIYAAVKGATTTNANTGVRASRLLWSGSQPVTWNSVSWNSVSWNSVSWNSVSWNSVSWNSVSWNSVSWNSNSNTEIAPQYNCRDVDPTGLLGHWRLDETNGNFVADASGNDNVGTLSNQTFRQNGRRNGAAQLNNGAINIPATTTLNNLTNQLTVSAWLYRTSANGGWQNVVARQYGSGNEDQFFLSLYDNTYAFGVNTVANGAQWVTYGINNLNQWVHLVGVYNGSQITLYINGLAVTSKNVSGNLRTDTKPILIGANANGANPDSGNEFVLGRVDDIRMYKRALTAIEVGAIYSGLTATAQAPLVIYDDQLQSNWLDWSWDTTRNFNNTTPLYSGNKTLALSYTQAWGGLHLYAVNPVSTSGYTALRFRVHGGASGMRPIQIMLNNNATYVVVVDVYANQWAQVDIPLGAMGAPSSITNIYWQDKSGGPQPTIYLDQIELVAQ